MMIPTWHEPNENTKILDALSIKDTQSLPLFIAFTELQSGEILKTEFALDDKSPERAYERLKTIISMISKAVGNIDIKNKSDYESVFNGIDMTMRDFKIKESVKDLFGLYRLIKENMPI